MGAFTPVAHVAYDPKVYLGVISHLNAPAEALKDGFAAGAGGGVLAAAGGFALGAGIPFLALDIAGVTPAQIFQGAPSAGQFSKSAQSFHDTMLNSAKTLCSTKWTPSGTVALSTEEARACGLKQITDTFNSLKSGKQLPGSQFSNEEAQQAYNQALRDWNALHPDVPQIPASNPLGTFLPGETVPISQQALIANAGAADAAGHGLIDGILASATPAGAVAGAVLAANAGNLVKAGLGKANRLLANAHQSPLTLGSTGLGTGGLSIGLLLILGVAAFFLLRKAKR